MGKHLPFSRRPYGVELEEHQPGCFWGMLHVLDYHHWQYVKRLLHHKKHHPRRRRFRCCAAPKTISFTRDAGEIPEHVDTEAEHLLGQHHVEEGNALAVKDISKEETGKKHDPLGDDRTNPRSTKVEEELFQRIIQDPHFGMVKDLAIKHEGIGKPRFTKARSFPFPDSSGPRHYRAPTLKHKQSEVWFFPGGDRKTSLVDLNGPLKHETTSSSLDSSQTLGHHGWNHLIISQFRGIKRRIKRALKESRKGSSPAEVTVDHRSSSDDRVEESKLQRMTRLSSLNESLDKYSRLFEESFTAESKASKLKNSKSLKLTAEDKISTPKTFRRRLSLLDHEALSSLLSDLSYDNLYSGLSTRTKPESSNSKELKSKNEHVHGFTKIDSLEKSLEVDYENLATGLEPSSVVGGGTEELHADSDIPDENSVKLLRTENVGFHGEETTISSKATSEAEPSSPGSVLHSFRPVDNSEPEAFHLSEGVDIRPCGSSSVENVCTRNEATNNPIEVPLGMVLEDECDFSFVKDILKLGGFFEDEFIKPWESIDLPLNPKLFDELGVSELHGLECFEGYSMHQVLFDLINEALIDVYEMHFTYCPGALSSSRFTRPVTKGQHLLEEVWTRVKQYRGIQGDPTLDDIVGRDMAKGDRWMDLNWESECAALELEDMILDELVVELMHS